MTNQINSTPKAILFLLPPYDVKTEKICQDTKISCTKSNLTLIKVIKAQNSYDYKAFVMLIQEVIKEPGKPIMVIIDEDILNTIENMIMWIVLGTLIAAKLIVVATYERYHSDIKLVELTKYESRLLAFAAYLFKTYYLVNRNKKIKADKQKSNGSTENSITKNEKEQSFK